MKKPHNRHEECQALLLAADLMGECLVAAPTPDKLQGREISLAVVDETQEVLQ